MKARLLFSFLLLAGVAVQEMPAADEVLELPPYVVKGTPLGFIGVKHVTVTVGMLGMFSERAKIKGLVVDEVIADSPAQKAGLVPKDKVLRIDGTLVSELSIRDLKKYSEKEVGEKIVMEVRGADQQTSRTVEVIAGRKPKKPDQKP